MLGEGLTGETLKRFYDLTSLENTAISAYGHSMTMLVLPNRKGYAHVHLK